MTEVFADTSALYAVMDAGDDHSVEAISALTAISDKGSSLLVTHSYAAAELISLVQRRLGMDAVRSLVDDVLPAVEIRWVAASLHDAGVTAMRAAGRRQVSFVDWVSFEFMRREQIEDAFAFDDDFAEQGFRLVTP